MYQNFLILFSHWLELHKQTLKVYDKNYGPPYMHSKVLSSWVTSLSDKLLLRKNLGKVQVITGTKVCFVPLCVWHDISHRRSVTLLLDCVLTVPLLTRPQLFTLGNGSL